MTILPLMDFGMAVPEGKTGGIIVAAGGIIYDFFSGVRRAVPTVHLHHEVTVIDGVFALVQQHESRRWPRLRHVGELAEDLKVGIQTKTASVTVGCVIPISSNPVAHGI